jgi:hypothetical protein
MTAARKRRRVGAGQWFHRLIVFVCQLVDAFRHVRSGGRTTTRRARCRAAAPPRRCPECRQFVEHSPDWRDHLDEHRDHTTH